MIGLPGRVHWLPWALGTVLTSIALITLIAPWLAPFDPAAVDPTARLLAPGLQGHLLGTDSVGRDVLSRLLYGARLSVGVGVAAMATGAALGITLGCVGGWFGGWVDALLGWLIDLQLAFPFVLLAIFLLGALGGGITPVVTVIALGTWVNFARAARVQTQALRSLAFVEWARISGAGTLRILGLHVMPNMLGPIAELGSFSLAQGILTEAALSFLGVGLDPSTPSWGTMLNDGRDYLADAWWIATMPGLAIGITVLFVTVSGERLATLGRSRALP